MSHIKTLVDLFDQEFMQTMNPEEIAEYMIDIEYENQAHRAFYNEYL